ncbi:hypothetical protein ACNKHP_21390 [Shigella boydii]
MRYSSLPNAPGAPPRRRAAMVATAQDYGADIAWWRYANPRAPFVAGAAVLVTRMMLGDNAERLTSISSGSRQ